MMGEREREAHAAAGADWFGRVEMLRAKVN